MGASGTPSMITRNCTGAPLTFTLTIAVTWLSVQRVSLSLGTLRQSVLDVVAGVVVHLEACRSSEPPNAPLAARTAAGTVTSTTAPAAIAMSLRMVRLLGRLRRL